MHTTALVIIGEWLTDRRSAIEQRRGLFRDTLHLIAVFTIIIILHLLETAIWAVFYFRLSLFETFETSLYFSIVTYATIGYGDIVLPKAWRLLAGIEGISGVLLCGLSTAFVFVLINAIMEMRRQQSTRSRDGAE